MIDRPTHEWACDCKSRLIRWVDEKLPHPAAKGPGWFCMGCLAEFLPAGQVRETDFVNLECQLAEAREQRDRLARLVEMFVEIPMGSSVQALNFKLQARKSLAYLRTTTE